MAGEIRIRADVFDEMLRHARREPETECCGMLAGRDGIITKSFPTENTLASATRYEIAPRDLFQFFRRIRQEELEHLGHYHSHTHTENFPSASDISQAYYPDQAYFIVSPRAEESNPVRAFLIREGKVQELKIEITANS